MGIVSVPTFGADPVTITGPTLDAKVDGLATEFNGNIDNDNIDSSAAIANSKLNLASVAQNVSFAGTVALTGANTISGVTTMSSKIFKFAKGADVASANALTLGTDGNYFDITGTTAITSIGTLGVGTVVKLHFDGILTFTHHSTDLILPGGASITTAAGDEAELVEYASGDWRCTSYVKASGAAIVPASFASSAEVKTGTEAAKSVAPNTIIAHEGVIKGWVTFVGSSVTTDLTGVSDSFNVASVTDNGAGDYTVAWATDFGNANYCLMGLVLQGGDSEDPRVLVVNTVDAGSTRVKVSTGGTFSAQDRTVYLAAIGDR